MSAWTRLPRSRQTINCFRTLETTYFPLTFVTSSDISQMEPSEMRCRLVEVGQEVVSGADLRSPIMEPLGSMRSS